MFKSSLFKFMAFVIAVLTPLQNILFALGILILFDLVTGLWKAMRTGTFSSRKFAHSISKIALYFIALVTCQVSDQFFDLPKIASIVAGLIAVTEVVSILENVSAISGVPIIDKVLSILKRTPNA